jgi:hypothetical protein
LGAVMGVGEAAQVSRKCHRLAHDAVRHALGQFGC